MATVTRTIDNVGSAIADVIAPYITDVTFEDSAYFAVLEAMGKVVMPDPSYKLSWPVITGELNTGMYRGLTKFPGEEKSIFQLAQVDWKGAFCDTVVSGQDLLRARGNYAAYQLSDALKDAARRSITSLMGRQTYEDGTGNNLDGTNAAIDDGNLTAAYAGLTRSGIDGWQSHVDGTGALFTPSLLTTAIGNATYGNTRPNLGITNIAQWNAFHDRASAIQRFDVGDGNNMVASLGFTVLSYMGMSIVHDAKCAAGNFYGITCDQVEIAVMKDRVWAWSGWEKIPGGDGFEAQFLWYGNFMYHAPRQMFRLHSLT